MDEVLNQESGGCLINLTGKRRLMIGCYDDGRRREVCR
jgi:hypothetical protein